MLKKQPDELLVLNKIWTGYVGGQAWNTQGGANTRDEEGEKTMKNVYAGFRNKKQKHRDKEEYKNTGEWEERELNAVRYNHASDFDILCRDVVAF